VKECLRLQDVSFTYGRGPVLEGVSFSALTGEILGILGPNGAGKTTLLKCLLRSETPDQGTIEIMGRDIGDYSQRELAGRISYVPQEMTMPFPYTVSEVAMMGRYPHLAGYSLETEKDGRIVMDTLEKTDTLELRDRLFNELSGGEKKRVVLARAMIQDAPIMLLDEPTANLDIRHITLLLESMLELRREKGRTLVFVTHDLNIASTIADRLILLKQGRIAAMGAPGEILDIERIRQVYETGVKMITDPETDRPFYGYRLPS